VILKWVAWKGFARSDVSIYAFSQVLAGEPKATSLLLHNSIVPETWCYAPNKFATVPNSDVTTLHLFSYILNRESFNTAAGIRRDHNASIVDSITYIVQLLYSRFRK
jgi:hypothetical protein